MTRWISVSRPMTGSRRSSSAYLVRLRPNWSSTLELLRSLRLRPVPRRGGAPLGPAAGAGQHPHDFLARAVGVDVQVVEDTGRHTLALPHEAEEDVLGADVVVAQRQRFAQRQFEHLLGPRREGDLALRLVVALAHDAGDFSADLFQADFEGAKHPRGHAVGLAQEPEEEMLRADVVVAEHPRLFLGQDDHLARSLCEPFKHHCFLLSPDARACKHFAHDPSPYLVDLGAFQIIGLYIHMVHYDMSRLEPAHQTEGRLCGQSRSARPSPAPGPPVRPI